MREIETAKGDERVYGSVYNVDVEGYILVDEKERDFASVDEMVSFTGRSRAEIERAVYDYAGVVEQGRIVFRDDDGVEGFTHYINSR